MTADIDMSGATSAQRPAAYVARENATTVPPPPSRPPPPALGALAGIDVVEHGELMVASTGSRITVCRARPTPHGSPLIDVARATERSIASLHARTEPASARGARPFRFDLSGVWDLLLTGGMRRRSAPCPPP